MQSVEIWHKVIEQRVLHLSIIIHNCHSLNFSPATSYSATTTTTTTSQYKSRTRFNSHRISFQTSPPHIEQVHVLIQPINRNVHQHVCSHAMHRLEMLISDPLDFSLSRLATLVVHFAAKIGLQTENLDQLVILFPGWPIDIFEWTALVPGVETTEHWSAERRGHHSHQAMPTENIPKFHGQVPVRPEKQFHGLVVVMRSNDKTADWIPVGLLMI